MQQQKINKYNRPLPWGVNAFIMSIKIARWVWDNI